MIQDITPHQFDNTYRRQKAKDKDFVIHGNHGRILMVSQDGQAKRFPMWEEVKEKCRKEPQFLFRLDGQSYVLVLEDIEEQDEMIYFPQDIFRRFQPSEQAFAGITGMHLARWYVNHQFCGRCGHGLEHSKTERALVCPQCGNLDYPKISPAVIIAVIDKNRILLSKYAGRDYKNYALLAGFVEIGECLEDTVIREVQEEVGLKVKNPQYYKSQPWAFSDTLLAGYFVELDGDDIITMDEEELALAGWCPREDMPVRMDGVSLTSEMMEVFRKGEDPYAKNED